MCATSAEESRCLNRQYISIKCRCIRIKRKFTQNCFTLSNEFQERKTKRAKQRIPMFLGDLKENSTWNQWTHQNRLLYIWFFLLANIASNINQYVCVCVCMCTITNWFFTSIVFPKTKNYTSRKASSSRKWRRRRKNARQATEEIT